MQALLGLVLPWLLRQPWAIIVMVVGAYFAGVSVERDRSNASAQASIDAAAEVDRKSQSDRLIDMQRQVELSQDRAKAAEQREKEMVDAHAKDLDACRVDAGDAERFGVVRESPPISGRRATPPLPPKRHP